MATLLHFSRYDIGSLCERLEARGMSRLLKAQPELTKDLLSSAAILRWMLEQGMPVSSCDVEVQNNGG